MARLGEVCSLITDGSHFSPKDIGKGYPMMSVKDMEEKDFSFNNCKHISEEDYQILLRNGCKPQKGDVLLAKDGSFFKYAFVVEEDRELAVLSSIAILRPKTEIIDPRYLREFLMADSTYETVSLNYISGTALKRVILQGIKKIDIPLPPINEQQRIAERFIKIDELIVLRKEQLAKLDQLVKSRFIELFGDPILNQKGYPCYTVDDVIEFQGGSQPDKSFFEYEPTEDNIRLIQIRDYKTDKYITYIPKSKARRFCTADDIMIGRYGPPIFQILKGIEGSFNVALMKATPKKGNREFIRHFLMQDCLLEYLEGLSKRTAGQDGIQMDKLKAYPFPYPPMELQEQFAAFAKEVEKSKLAIQQSLDKLELLKKSLMQEYFG